MNAFPSRIVCLSAEAVEVLFHLGCGERIVGVTRYAAYPPEVRSKPVISGFSDVKYGEIDELRPDLVITFSDIQAEVTKELMRRGHTVLATNQRSVEEVFRTIVLIGRAVGCEPAALELADAMRREIFAQDADAQADRPRVYFEEWDEPMITGIRWVGELIDAAGGVDIFPEMRDVPRAPDRVVAGDEVIKRAPDIIVASWCGKKANLDAIKKRPGWDAIPAVRNAHVHEIKSTDILQPGPGLLRGFRQLREIIRGRA